ncbi:hypothetical protein [Siansivirga zeaxanthinifaciens]|uniref:Secretion system C-terminal sorting domain-containing protein n=1 Tax=Siansivirga zeaxanthinifaciens CC-SAMT-1 TaxID=1454006 RepID=A0A0C5W6N0_9FLAO|nr:hypothetical protein [Siansivirga zeaxanthinifaciens]AJR02793.1 hypothetical protein AW14_03210 [Siansivirga zeaxanthinifaciens CC-SAMT-1]
MKNLISTIKKGSLVVAVLTSLIGNAKETTLLKDKMLIEKTALTLNNVKAGNVLTIKDLDGIILYKELIKMSGTYKKGFDLTALPNGDYFFEVDKDLEIQTIPFTVTNNIVFLNKDKETTTFKPYVKKVNDLVYVTKLAPKKEAMTISIYSYNNSEELIHTEKVEGTQTIEKVYKLQKGDYRIVFKTEDKEFTEFINN